MKHYLLTVLFLLAVTLGASAQKAKNGKSAPKAAMYKVDALHSSLVFVVGYKMSEFHGSFGEMTGTLKLEDEQDFTTAQVDFSVPIASINTNSKTRDGHLQGEGYFNTAEAPLASFKSSYIKSLGDSKYEVTGDLTVAGKTLAQTIHVTLLDRGVVKDQNGKAMNLLGISTQFSFNRSNFGITGGLPLITDKVEVKGGLSMVKQ
ncbi:MAG: YceI family protein [Aureispira sp.]